MPSPNLPAFCHSPPIRRFLAHDLLLRGPEAREIVVLGGRDVLGAPASATFAAGQDEFTSKVGGASDASMSMECSATLYTAARRTPSVFYRQSRPPEHFHRRDGSNTMKVRKTQPSPPTNDIPPLRAWFHLGTLGKPVLADAKADHLSRRPPRSYPEQRTLVLFRDFPRAFL